MGFALRGEPLVVLEGSIKAMGKICLKTTLSPNLTFLSLSSSSGALEPLHCSVNCYIHSRKTLTIPRTEDEAPHLEFHTHILKCVVFIRYTIRFEKSPNSLMNEEWRANFVSWAIVPKMFFFWATLNWYSKSLTITAIQQLKWWWVFFSFLFFFSGWFSRILT